ncbi:MAG: hypothetical protein N2053_09655 [Chitinispirillaceae bacterium]|nr:hypothetical protein [Chitinispirillaceae bacterium]
MEEKKDKILDEEREEFNNQLKEILDAGPDKYQRKESYFDKEDAEKSKRFLYYEKPEESRYIFLYTLIRIIAIAFALFLLVKFGIHIASR